MLALIDNAMRYAPGQLLHISAGLDEGQAVATVTDGGLGLSEEALRHAFEPSGGPRIRGPVTRAAAAWACPWCGPSCTPMAARPVLAPHQPVVRLSPFLYPQGTESDLVSKLGNWSG